MAISLEKLQTIVDDFRANLSLEIQIKVVEKQEDEYGSINSAEQRGYAIEGVYHPAGRKIVLVASSFCDEEHARQALRHEVFGHYGLNTLLPEDKSELLHKVTYTRSAKELKGIWSHVDRDYPNLSPLQKAEEVFAYVAEQPQTFASVCWTWVRAYLHKALRVAGLLHKDLSAQELQHEANCIARGIRRGQPQRTFPQADADQFRKVKHDPRQLTFTFDAMVNHIETLREENVSEDTPGEPAYGPNGILLGENGQELPPPVLPDFDPARLLADLKAQRARIEQDALRQRKLPVFDANLEGRIARLEQYFKETSQERPHDRRPDSSAGNSPARPETRNDMGDSAGRVSQFSLLDSGQVGAEQPRAFAGMGGAGIRLSAGSPGSADDTGKEDTGQRYGLGDVSAGDERLGDLVRPGGGHGTGSGRRNPGKTEAGNYRITAEDNLGAGGARAKYADNIAAIRLLKELQKQDGREASPGEKKILVRYVGWGGLSQAFDPKNDKWEKEYRELQSLLSPDDYAKARRSTQDAHYTSETVIRAMYQGLARLGLRNGSPQILEPSAGIGNFIGLCPEGLSPNFLAVELDPTSSAIAQYLYPTVKHRNTGFQNSALDATRFDAVIGNPPFGQQSLYDPDFPELRGFSIHNYFLAKSIRLLREGGVAAFVVSRYFMDAANPTVREDIARHADFLGAVRLPDSAFKQNALAEVTADIVFFQKNSGEKHLGPDWTHTAAIEVEDHKEGGRKPVAINRYFAEHPDRIIGKMIVPASGGMYAGAVTCEADPALDLGPEIEKRLESLREVYIPQDKTQENILAATLDEELLTSPYFHALKMGAYCVEPQSRKIVYKTQGGLGDSAYEFLPLKNDGARARISAMIQIRDTLRALLNAEKTDAGESGIEGLRRQLNHQYDTFVRNFGHLNSQTNRALMREDPEHALLESLETGYDKGLSPEAAKRQGRAPRKPSAKKAAIFGKRVLYPTRIADRADSAKDALIIALRETGRVDFARMEHLLRRPAESIQRELRKDGLIFLNPACREAGQEWEIRDKYLTGNVRSKLALAREAAASDERYQVNVDALAEAMPPDIEAVDIGIKFGSAWVPGNVLSDFIEHLHGGHGDARREISRPKARYLIACIYFAE